MGKSTPPDVGHVARAILRSMLVTEPVSPLGVVSFYDDDGTPYMTVSVTAGTENARRVHKALEALRPTLGPVDIFDEDGVLRVNLDNEAGDAHDGGP